MRFIFFFALVFVVSCTPQDKPTSVGDHVSHIADTQSASVVNSDHKTLESWWVFFDDPTLERFVTSALALNPPGESDLNGADLGRNSYDSYRLRYHDPRIDLIKTVSALYVEYRYLQNRKVLMEEYIQSYEGIERFARTRDFLDDPRIVPYQKSYVEMAEKSNQISVKLEKNARAIAQTTKLLPEYIAQVLKTEVDLPASDITLILASPISVLVNAPDIAAARAKFANDVFKPQIFETSTDIFATGTLSNFLGVSDSVFLDSAFGWSVSVGAAYQNLDFTPYKKAYGQSRQHAQAYASFEQTVQEKVSAFERLFVTFVNLQEQHNVLSNALIKAQEKLSLIHI